MPIRRNPKTIIETLLKFKALASNGTRNVESLNESIDIVEELLKIEKKFPLAKHWDELVVEELNDLEQDAAKENFDEEILQRMNEKIKRIQSILKISEDLKPVSDTNTSTESQSKTPDDWEASENWEKLGIETSILEDPAMAVFRASYDYLREDLRHCLLYFSAFPINSVVKKRPLIYWWIGEGLVNTELMGEDYLKELQKNGMIIPVRKNRSPTVCSYQMHPWIHRMVVSVAWTAGFFDFDETGKLKSDSSTSHRICFVSREIPRDASSSKQEGVESTTAQAGGSNSKPEEAPKVERKLSEGSGKNGSASRQVDRFSFTMFNVNQQFLKIEQSRLSRTTKLAVLQLGRWQNSAIHHVEVDDAKFLADLGVLKHLKYLSFRGMSRITDLPESIGKLRSLEILDLRACHNLEKLPYGIKSMKKLTHLDVSECYLLEEMPRGIGALSALQVLKGFVIGNSRSKDPCGLEDLERLKKLTKLSLIFGTDAIVLDDELSKLKQFTKLRILGITWGGVVQPTGTATSTATSVSVIEGAQSVSARLLRRAVTMSLATLSIPDNLEKLDLRCFPKKDPPAWLIPSSLKNLKRLYIRGGQLSRLSLSSHGSETWGVKILRLKFLEHLKIEEKELTTNFPNLSYLEKVKCDGVQWSKCDDHGVWVRELEDTKTIR
ncbi:hypothetical protein ACHQM5_026725 [Ranunculus cassubicifolius]